MLNNKLYKVDSKGKIRVYYIEIILDQYRMITGVLNGKEVKSKWTVAKPKNIGKTNETSGEAQAIKEVAARYEKKEAQGYYKSEDEAKANPDGNFFSPMLAYEVDKVIDKYKVFPMVADPKLDGMRMTAKGTEVISRKGKTILTAEHIVDDLEEFFIENDYVRLDGELYNHKYKDDFNTLMSIARQVKPDKKDLQTAKEKLQFHVYDVYFYNDTNTSALNRKLWLKANLPVSNIIKLVPFKLIYDQGELDIIKEQHLEGGYEGTITRDPDSVYETKRSHWLLKHKDFITEEFEILDIMEGTGNRSGMAGNIVISVNGVEVGCGIRGSFNYFKEILETKNELIGSGVTIRHFGRTPDGSLRFPVCIDINRPD